MKLLLHPGIALEHRPSQLVRLLDGLPGLLRFVEWHTLPAVLIGPFRLAWFDLGPQHEISEGDAAGAFRSLELPTEERRGLGPTEIGDEGEKLSVPPGVGAVCMRAVEFDNS